jgi:microcystin-dependent protein
MSYKLNYTDTAANPTPITVPDQDLNTTSTDLTFVGKNFPGYSQSIGENFLHLLENFASPTAPPKAISGQLWFDTTTNKNQLKVYDGVKWSEAGNVKKGATRPSTTNSLAGDLWVDTSNQQLYLYTGAIWVLVGPQFSEGTSSGLKAESVIDRSTNTARVILVFYTGGSPVVIISKDAFTPKTAINGFETINQGINLSTADFDGDGINLNKFWGTSEKANSLVIGNSVVPASNFLRSDTVSTTNFTINIRNGTGLVIGDSLQTSLTSSGSGAILNHRTTNSPIILQQGGNSILTVINQKVGINNISPAQALDVTGSALISGSVAAASLTLSNNALIGSSLSVGTTLTVGGTTTVKNILPNISGDYNIGSPLSNSQFKNIYSENFYGTEFYGNFNGDVTGSSDTAASLSTVSNFSIIGDMISGVETFDGTTDVTLTVVVNEDIISGKEALSVDDTRTADRFLVLSNKFGTLRSINKETLFSTAGTVPTGSIMPYAGDTPPPGYLLCDGSEQSRGLYSDLFTVLGYKYKAEELLVGYQTFALPDLRGRFPIGRDNMDNGNEVNVQISASGATRLAITALSAIQATFVVKDGVPPTPGAAGTVNGPFQTGKVLSGTGLTGTVTVTSVTPNTPSAGFSTIVAAMPPQSVTYPAGAGLVLTSLGNIDGGGGTASRVSSASTLGIAGGTDDITIGQNNLPDHVHDLKDSVGNQYYAIRNATGAVPEPEVVAGSIHFTSGAGHLLKNSGGVNTATLGQSMNIMNPYQTINYIIFTGRTLS